MSCTRQLFFLSISMLLFLPALFAGEPAFVAPDPATAIAVSNRTMASALISWTAGTGSRRIVVVRAASGAATIAPANGIGYTVGTEGSYTSAGNATTGAGNVVLYNGTGSSVSITGLSTGTTYIAVVYEYNGSGSSTEYSTGLSSGTFSTLAAEPTGQVAAAGISFGGVQSNTSVRIDYPSAASAAIGANGYLLLYMEGSGVTLSAGDLPADGTAYATGNTIGSATVGAFIISSSQSASTVSGLSGTKHYTFFLLPYAGSATNSTYNYNTSGSIPARYVPSFSGAVVSAGGEAASISSLINTGSITNATEGVQVWQFTIAEGADDDALPTIIKNVTINTPASNQFNFYNGIQSAALFLGSTPVAATLTIASGSDQLQFSGISNVAVPDNGSLTLSLRISVKANVNAGASSGSNNKDGARFVFQISNVNISAEAAASSSQLSAFTAVSSAVSGANIYSVLATMMQFAQAPPAAADPYVALSPSVAVETVDAGGNRDVDFTGTVTLSSSLGIDGVVSTSPIFGLATFAGLYFTAGGTTTLNAAGGAFTVASPNVTVSSVSVAGVYTFNAAATCAGGGAYTPSLVNSHLTLSSLTLTGISCNSNGNLNGATTAATILSTNASWGTALDAGKYIEFTATPASNYSLQLTAVAFETLRTAAGATNYTLRSSLDGFSSDLGSGTVTTTQSAVLVSLPSSFVNLSGAVSFRLYPWGGGSTGNFRVDNLVLRGTTASGLLPVRLLWFRGRLVDSGAQLDWATASETNNASFTVERSFDGRRFEPLGTVPSAAVGGSSSSPLTYSYQDAALPAADAWYRLRQTDIDGHRSFSAVVYLRNSGRSQYPISVVHKGGRLQLALLAPENGSCQVAVFSADGRCVTKNTCPLTKGYCFAEVDAPQAAGIYFVLIVLPGGATWDASIRVF
jgi:hypothetical protein